MSYFIPWLRNTELKRSGLSSIGIECVEKKWPLGTHISLHGNQVSARDLDLTRAVDFFLLDEEDREEEDTWEQSQGICVCHEAISLVSKIGQEGSLNGSERPSKGISMTS